MRSRRVQAEFFSLLSSVSQSTHIIFLPSTVTEHPRPGHTFPEPFSFFFFLSARYIQSHLPPFWSLIIKPVSAFNQMAVTRAVLLLLRSDLIPGSQMLFNSPHPSPLQKSNNFVAHLVPPRYWPDGCFKTQDNETDSEKKFNLTKRKKKQNTVVKMEKRTGKMHCNCSVSLKFFFSHHWE